MNRPRFIVDQVRNGWLGPLSFELAKSECVALMGVSGAGKSLLLRLLVDLDPGEGRVWLHGKERADMAAVGWRRQVMLVPSAAGWWLPTAGEHIHASRWTEAERLAVEMGLPNGILAREIDKLSTGERQRLALIRAMVESPEVLLLDEPTSGLDADTTLAVERSLAAARQTGTAILLVTHDITQARRMATRLYRMKHGVLKPE